MATYKSFSIASLLLQAVLLSLAATTVLAYRPIGFPCRANFQCDTQNAQLYCNTTRQCDQMGEPGQTCPTHSACRSGRCSGGVCQLQIEVGGACAVSDDCLDGYCDGGVCAALKGREEACVTGDECNSGRCFANPRRCTFVIYEPAICGNDFDCFGGRCKKDRGLNQCYARKFNDVFCNDNSDCLSLRCETRNCTEPVWEGDPCDEPSDCYSLFCNKDKGVCVATADEAGDNMEIEPEIAGISGSESAQIANGGGKIDIDDAGGSGGETFGSSDNGSGAGRNVMLDFSFAAGVASMMILM